MVLRRLSNPSIHPPITGPAWISIYTGLDPSVFNRYHFNHYDPEDRSFSVTSRSGVDYEYFWERLDEKRICLLNLPMTYPPSDRDDTIVCGQMGAPGSVVTKPDSLTDDVADAGVSLRYHDPTEASKSDPEAFMTDGTKQFEVMSDAWHVFEDRESWDLFFAQFSVADWAHHFLWDDLEANPDDSYLQSIYERIDSFLGEIRDTLGSDDDLVIVSDHGGGKCEGVLYLNELLRREGLLALEDDNESFSSRALSDLGVTKSMIRKADILGLVDYVTDYIPTRVKSSVPTKGSGTMLASLIKGQAVDWDGTSAYALSGGPLFCDEGAVSVIESRLRELGLTPEFVDLHTEYVASPDQMPDYMVYIDDLAFEVKDRVYTDDIVVHSPDYHPHQGSHRRDGVFIGAGPSFETVGFRETSAWLPDVAPTLLTILNRGIPEAMTGRPLTDLLDDDSLADGQPEQVSCDIHSDTSSLKNSEEQQVNERLQNLGYLE